VPAWDEYDQLEAALDDYLDHEPDDPAWNDVWRALAAILGEYQRDAFIEAFDLASPAETACIRRLITGESSCPHSPLEPDPDPEGPHNLMANFRTFSGGPLLLQPPGDVILGTLRLSATRGRSLSCRHPVNVPSRDSFP